MLMKICAIRGTSPPPMDEDDVTGSPLSDVVSADGSTSVLENEKELVMKTGKNEAKEEEGNEAAAKTVPKGTEEKPKSEITTHTGDEEDGEPQEESLWGIVPPRRRHFRGWGSVNAERPSSASRSSSRLSSPSQTSKAAQRLDQIVPVDEMPRKSRSTTAWGA
ncbi:unnamed protein product [Amoebophrya sp. A120]|nr:unnamed protein product [Amoebophrya sp. A120]|eukprot:GSA120T00008554001.1